MSKMDAAIVGFIFGFALCMAIMLYVTGVF